MTSFKNWLNPFSAFGLSFGDPPASDGERHWEQTSPEHEHLCADRRPHLCVAPTNMPCLKSFDKFDVYIFTLWNNMILHTAFNSLVTCVWSRSSCAPTFMKVWNYNLCNWSVFILIVWCRPLQVGEFLAPDGQAAGALHTQRDFMRNSRQYVHDTSVEHYQLAIVVDLLYQWLLLTYQ